MHSQRSNMLRFIVRIIAFIVVLCALIVLPAHSQEALLDTFSQASLASREFDLMEWFDTADIWKDAPRWESSRTSKPEFGGIIR